MRSCFTWTPSPTPGHPRAALQGALAYQVSGESSDSQVDSHFPGIQAAPGRPLRCLLRGTTSLSNGTSSKDQLEMEKRQGLQHKCTAVLEPSFPGHDPTLSLLKSSQAVTLPFAQPT